MERRVRWAVIGVLTLGALVSLVLAALTDGDPFDMESYRLVAQAMDSGLLHAYDLAPGRWPYPPGYFPAVHGADGLAGAGGVSFAFLVRLPPIAATAAIAWVVQDHLRARGRAGSTRIAAAALVSLGPSFFVIAGHHGQFDAVAMLPAVLAVSLWDRSDPANRALVAGLLIGLGGALKTVPLLVLIALLPSARSRREAVTLIGAAGLVVALAFAPFAVAGTLPALDVLNYRGVPGVGGLSLAVQPEIGATVMGTGDARFSEISRFVADRSAWFVAAGLVCVVAVGVRTRAPALPMTVLLWLAVYAFGVNFFFQYAVWGLPFLLMAGHLRAVLAAQAALALPMALFYLRPWEQPAVGPLYATLMIAVWGAAAAAFVVQARALLRRPAARTGAA